MPQKCRVRNWSSYTNALKRRGDLFFYFQEDFFESEWCFKGKRKPGGQVVYSDVAIETILTIKHLFRFAYRQTQGFLESMFKRLGLNAPIPDYSSMSRRAKCLSHKVKQYRRDPNKPLHLVLDSTGLSIYSGTYFHTNKHLKDRLGKTGDSWKKLHVAYDLTTSQVVNVELSDSRIQDAAPVEKLTRSPGQRIASIRADRAYDKRTCYMRAHELEAIAIIPPIRVARLQRENRNMHAKGNEEAMRMRDANINFIRNYPSYEEGAKAWKVRFNYHQRSLIEAFNHRFKRAFGYSLNSKLAETRKTEVIIKTNILNKQATLSRAEYERIT